MYLQRLLHLAERSTCEVQTARLREEQVTSRAPGVAPAVDLDFRPLLCKFFGERAVRVGMKRLSLLG